MMQGKGLRALLLVSLIVMMLGFMVPTYAAPVTITLVTNKDTGASAVPPNATSGSYEETIIVKGKGVTAGKTIKLYWDLVQDWDGEAGLLNSTKAEKDGTFEIWFTVPEAVNGTHYIWIEDVASKTYDNATFIVLPTLELSSDSGLPGDKITVEGYGFSAKANVTLSFVNKTHILVTKLAFVDKTSSLGSFSTSFKVPNVKYGAYNVSATDGKGVTVNATFTIGPVITLSPKSGPVGAVITVKGRGFTKGGKIGYGNVTLAGINCTLVRTIAIGTNGRFTGQFVVPSVKKTGKYTVNVTDSGGLWATATFEVNGLPSIKVEPAHAVQGETVNIYGYNFTQLKGKNVKVELWNATAKVADLGTYKTTSDGTFSGTFTVPAVATGIYFVNASQANYAIINVTKSFRAGLMIIVLNPTEGPVGTKVTITGSGFTKGGTWNATFGDEGVITTPKKVAADGTLSGSFYVPQVDPGTYTVTVLDINSEIEVTATFTVTDVTKVKLDPASAPQNYNVTIKGWNFADDNTTLTFIIYNETNSWNMGVWQGNKTKPKAAVTDTDGNFTAWWNFTDVAGSQILLDPGVYTINVTDGHDYFVQVTFTVVEETVECSSRKAEYNIGDTVAFNIKSSFPKVGSYIKIYDPDGNLFWETMGLTTWMKVDTYYTVPYYSQVDASGNPMILPPDAPTGTWTWKWYDSTDKLLASGNFTVLPAVEALLEERIASVEESVQALSEDVAGLSEEISGVKSDIAGVKSDIAALKSDVAAAASAAKDAKEAASAAQEAVAEVAETATAAKSAAEEAKAAAEEAKTAASGLTPLIYGAIGVSLIAALAAIVSLIQISRRIAG